MSTWRTVEEEMWQSAFFDKVFDYNESISSVSPAGFRIDAIGRAYRLTSPGNILVGDHVVERVRSIFLDPVRQEESSHQLDQ